MTKTALLNRIQKDANELGEAIQHERKGVQIYTSSSAACAMRSAGIILASSLLPAVPTPRSIDMTTQNTGVMDSLTRMNYHND
jgi:hypothetical protein